MNNLAAELEQVLALKRQLAEGINPKCPHCRARQDIAVLKRTLAVLAEGNGSGTAIEAAIKMRKARSASSPNSLTAVAKRRARSAAVLATFHRTKPKANGHGQRVTVLVANGYLKRKGDGYVRTAKVFKA